MGQNIIEKLREEVINSLFTTKGFNRAWPVWKETINKLASTPTPTQLLNLGDNLRDVFYTTNTSTARTQSDVSGGGANWEDKSLFYGKKNGCYQT